MRNSRSARSGIGLRLQFAKAAWAALMASSTCSASARLVDADDLGGACRVDGGDLCLGANAFAADDEVVLVAEPGFDRGQRLLHRAFGLRVGEVEEGLVDEWSFGSATLAHLRRIRG